MDLIPNQQNALAALRDLLDAFPDETIKTGQRITRYQAGHLNAAIVRAKDVMASIEYAKRKAVQS